MKPSRGCYSPPLEEGWLRRVRKRPRSETGADGVVRIFSDHPGRAFLMFDGASTPPLEEGNRSGLAISSVEQQPLTPWAKGCIARFASFSAASEILPTVVLRSLRYRRIVGRAGQLLTIRLAGRRRVPLISRHDFWPLRV